MIEKNSEHSEAKISVSLRFYFCIVISCFAVGTLVCLLTHNEQSKIFLTDGLDRILTFLTFHEPFCVVVIDLGYFLNSSVTVFKFHEKIWSVDVSVDYEYIHRIIAEDSPQPGNVKNRVEYLIERSKNKIPEARWPKTLVVLKAALGMAVYLGNSTNRILSQSRAVLARSGYEVNNDSVKILNGEDEGIFCWFTVNYLLDRFHKRFYTGQSYTETATVLQLGGGSIQVTFDLHPDERLKFPRTNVHKLMVLNREVEIYSQSVMAVGLWSATNEIINHPDNHPVHRRKTLPRLTPDEHIETYSECFHPMFKRISWEYFGNKYYVRNPHYCSPVNSVKCQGRRFEDRFAKCLSIAVKFVTMNVTGRFPDISNRKLYAFSELTVKAIEAGLVDPIEGGTITVGSYFNAAMYACQHGNKADPFSCLQLTYIYALLRYGWGLHPYKSITVKRSIRGHYLSWYLAAAHKHMTDLNKKNLLVMNNKNKTTVKKLPDNLFL